MVEELGRGVVALEEALNWTLHNESLRSALVDNVRYNVDIPDEHIDTWHGEVETTNERGFSEFVVIIYP